MKVLNTPKKFQDEVERNDGRIIVQNDPRLFSYYDDYGCLNVVKLCSNKVHLLHKTNEENKIKIPHSEEGHFVNDVSEYKFFNSIVFYFSD